jgi:HEAT repeat protein
MKKRRIIRSVVILLALVATAFLIQPEYAAKVTAIFGGSDTFEGKPKTAWIADLRNPDENVYRKAQSHLDFAGGSENATPILIEALNDDSETTRARAAEILIGLGQDGKDAIPALTVALRDKSAKVRINSAQALQGMTPDSERAVPSLIELLKDEKDYVRRQAAGSLSSMGAAAKSKAWGALLNAHKKDPNPDVRKAAEDALLAIDKGEAEKAGMKKIEMPRRPPPPLR